MVVNALSRLFIGSIAYVEEENRELSKDVSRLAHMGVRHNSTEGWIVVTNGDELSLLPEVKENQDQGPILLYLKTNFHNQSCLL